MKILYKLPKREISPIHFSTIKITNVHISKVTKRDYEPGIRVKCKATTSCANCTDCPYRTGKYVSIPLDLIAPAMKLTGFLTNMLVEKIAEESGCSRIDKTNIKYSFIKKRSATIVAIANSVVPCYIILFKKYSSMEIRSMFLGKSFSGIFRWIKFGDKGVLYTTSLKERYKESVEYYENNVKDIIGDGQLVSYFTRKYRYTKRHLSSLVGKEKTSEIIDKLVLLGFIRKNRGLFFRTRKFLYVLLSLLTKIGVVVKAFTSFIENYKLETFISNLKYFKYLRVAGIDTT